MIADRWSPTRQLAHLGLVRIPVGKGVFRSKSACAVGLTSRVASALAGDRDHECRERIEKAEARLRREIDRHGERSRQAEKCRHELEEARERCRGDRDRDHNHENH
jgi:hypothetical protein